MLHDSTDSAKPRARDGKRDRNMRLDNEKEDGGGGSPRQNEQNIRCWGKSGVCFRHTWAAA